MKNSNKNPEQVLFNQFTLQTTNHDSYHSAFMKPNFRLILQR